jgi:hypothetical protein
MVSVFYGTVAGVRSEAGNLEQQNDFPDADIELKLKRVYSKIQRALGLTLATPLIDGTDIDFDMASEIAERFAAAWVLKKLGSQFESSVTELETEAKEDLAELKAEWELDVSDDAIEEDLIERTPFYSWNKNPILVNENSSPDEIEPVPRVNPTGVRVPRGRLDRSLQIGQF